MTEHPILFSGEMVQAIPEGRKVQTRRVMRPQPRDANQHYDLPKWEMWGGGYPDHGRLVKCPYGVPGDLLWVRETWATVNAYDDLKPSDIPKGDAGRWPRVWYRATDAHEQEYHQAYFGKWRPSIFMPRWASRITLEVVSVRVERVQSISEGDAEAAGVEPIMRDTGGFEPWGAPCPEVPCYGEAFATLWDSINAKRTITHEWEDDDGIIHRDKVPGGYSWQSNPWVWVVEFRQT